MSTELTIKKEKKVSWLKPERYRYVLTSEEVLVKVKAVSYTHLDVYKRQPLLIS